MKWFIVIYLLAVAVLAPRALKVRLKQPAPGGIKFATYPGLIVSVVALIDLGLVCYYGFSDSDSWLILIGLVIFVFAVAIILDHEVTHRYLPRRVHQPNLTWQGFVMLLLLVHIAAITTQYVHPPKVQANLRTPTPQSSFLPPHGPVWPPEPDGKLALTVK